MSIIKFPAESGRREWRLMRLLLSLLLLLNAAWGCLLENGMSSVYLSVFEDAVPGSIVGRIPFRMPEEGEHLDLKVVKGDDLVEIDEESQQLKLVSELDRDEGNSKFEAVVECRSSNSDSDFSQMNISVFVTVKDVNDNAPEFDEESYNITISEELPPGTIVFTDFEATDRDQPGPNSFVQYSIVSSKFSHLLDIPDPFKPSVVIKDRIDYEKIKEFEVEIEARDQGEPSQSSRATLKVTVTDANDHNPVFGHSLYTVSKVNNGELVLEPESIAAADGDALDAQIVYSLGGELSEQFSIDQRGVVRVRSDPPPPRATLVVHAVEKDQPERNATAVIRVDLGPKLHFSHRAYSARIPVSMSVGSQLLTAEAFSDNAIKPKYSLNGDKSLEIDKNSGVITVNSALTPGEHHWNVSASAGGETVFAPLSLTVDAAPEKKRLEFEKKEYQLQLGTVPIIGKLRLKGDSKARFTLMNMNKEFLIDNGGVIQIKPGARPSCSSCELIVVATDDEGTVTATKVLVKNTNYSAQFNLSSTFTLVALFVIVLIFGIVAFAICRRLRSEWKPKRRSNICWLNTNSDTGVTITGTLPAPSRYVVNSTEKAFESAKSPAPKRAQGAQLVPVTVSQGGGGAPTVYF